METGEMFAWDAIHFSGLKRGCGRAREVMRINSNKAYLFYHKLLAVKCSVGVKARVFAGIHECRAAFIRLFVPHSRVAGRFSNPRAEIW